jgi:hypothetical protein
MPPTCSSRRWPAGTLRCIGSTTYKEYRQYFEKDRALVRRFQKIDVSEPTVEDSIKILMGIRVYFENYHKLRYTADAIKAAVELSAKYINDSKLPDKAIDVIDELGASQMLLPESRRKKVVVRDVEEIVAKIARIPPKSVSKDDAEASRPWKPISAASSMARMRRSMRCLRRSSWRAPACASRKSPSAPICSPVPPAWARPKSPSSSPASWAWNSCAST